jgi:hypothetical protein
MSDHEQVSDGQKLTRRSVLKRGGTAGAAAAAGALVLPQLASGTNSDHEHAETLRLTVKNACFTGGPSDLAPDPDPLGQAGLFVSNFVVVGDIVSVHGRELKVPGKYYCKGVIFPLSNLQSGKDCASPHDGTYVDQYFAIPEMGSINGAGTEGDPAGLAPSNRFDDLTITGGTGMFLGACGDYGSLKPPPDGDGTEGEGPRQFGGTGTISFDFNLWQKAHYDHKHPRKRLGRGRR